MNVMDVTRREAASLDAVADAFEARAEDRTLTIGIIGLGYVGLPLAVAYTRKGYRVIGFDVDRAKIERLAANHSYIKHIPNERITAMRDAGLFDPTNDFDRLNEPDALLICVPTPLNAHREPDLSYVESTTRQIAQRLRAGQIVVLESTTYPGTSEEVMLPILEDGSGLKAGVDFALAYSPEREDPGNPDFETSTIPKVIGANSDAERRMASALYSGITETVAVSNLRTAEAVKLTENIFRLINIAHVNELKSIFMGMDIDVWEVIEAAATKPFGFMPFYPGPGLGGHCIPIDPFYLTWKARAYGEHTRFIELAGEICTRMPRVVIETLARAMSDRLQKSVSGSRIVVVGLAYKKNVDDMRESPSMALIDLLRRRGADVVYIDPYFQGVMLDRHHADFADLKELPTTPEALSSVDCALIATDHDDVDYDAILEHVPLIIDTRNALKAYAGGPFAHKIVKA